MKSTDRLKTLRDVMLQLQQKRREMGFLTFHSFHQSLNASNFEELIFDFSFLSLGLALQHSDEQIKHRSWEREF
ncbi:hypothetical protein Mapa_004539 [Marchantia paleacea]|nr:hypothetical protein Mapa_004539 [Marchantia paleacea]